MKKDKNEITFIRKINSICVDFRFYKKEKKDIIINPCLEEYHKQIDSGVSQEVATRAIANRCLDTLERKYEKHNKYLSLLLFCIAFCVFTFLIEFNVFRLSFAFINSNNVNDFIIWNAVMLALLIGFVVFLALTHSGRMFHYVIIGTIMALYIAMGIIYIYFGYFDDPSGCLSIQDIDYLYNPFIFRVKNSYSCSLESPSSQNNISLPNLDTFGSLALLAVSLVLYFVEYYKQNKYYPRNNLSNLSTEYGKTTKAEKVKIRKEGLQYYYSFIDLGYEKKDAFESTMNHFTNDLGIARVKNNRFLFSLITISSYFVLILIYSLIYVFASSYTAWCGGLLGFILGVTLLLFIIMLATYNRFYWYDFVFVAVMIILLIVEIVTIVDLPDHVDTSGSIYYQSYFPVFNVQVVERTGEVIQEDGSIIQEIYSLNNYIIPSYNMMGAIVMAVIIIPLFVVKHHRLKQ